MRKNWRIATSVALAVVIGCAALVALTVWSGNKTEMRWVGTNNDNGWAVAEFIVKPGVAVPWVQDVGVGSDAKIHVLRDGEWMELSAAEMRQRIAIVAGTSRAAGAPKAGRGYTVSVKVPQCEKWKMEIAMGEQRTIGPAMMGFQFDNTQQWNTGELAGWTEPDSAKEI
jgi:hypothetical protein